MSFIYVCLYLPLFHSQINGEMPSGEDLKRGTDLRDTSRFTSQLLLLNLNALGHMLTPDLMSFGLGVAVWPEQPARHWTDIGSLTLLPWSGNRKLCPQHLLSAAGPLP